MKIIPAIYLKNGKVVSLYKGNFNDQMKTYPRPAKIYAEGFASQGAQTLLIVDLDGDQESMLSEIRDSFGGEVWWAGQVRTVERIQELLDLGADRIILGNSAEPIYADALSQFGPEKLIAGIKVKHLSDGAELCEKLAETTFTDILIKDLNAEGTLFHPSFDLFEKCVYFSGKNVYSSGGISDEKHIDWLNKLGIKGCVISRAFYENKLSVGQLSDHYSS